VPGGNGYFLARILPYRSSNNEIDGVLVTFVDVTNIVAAKEQHKVLTAELSHRVKNALAVVSSIADRTLPDGQEKTDLIGRFHALGHTHDLLSEAGWTEAALSDVILTELAPHSAVDSANVRVNGPPVMLKPQAALLLALVVHELATNAAKHGALSASGGRINIDWSIVGPNQSRLELIWREQGGPIIEHLSKRGFGTELIERGIRFELQGEAKLEVAKGSLLCRIIIPADPKYLSFGAPDRSVREEAAS
jgi:two-component system CheB/CheR fusion protein